MEEVIVEKLETNTNKANFSVKLLWVTPNAEKQVMYMARVSAENRDSESTRLLGYLLKENHVSPFEMANMCVEISGSRAILRQILRHRSFSFQELSQRYAKISMKDMTISEARRQDTKNRQNSIDDLPKNIQNEWKQKQESLNTKTFETYSWALENGIAKECARNILPEGNTTSILCMNGTLRSWIHFLKLRTGNGTQGEHQQIASACLDIFKEQFPIIAKAVFDSC